MRLSQTLTAAAADRDRVHARVHLRAAARDRDLRVQHGADLRVAAAGLDRSNGSTRRSTTPAPATRFLLLAQGRACWRPRSRWSSARWPRSPSPATASSAARRSRSSSSCRSRCRDRHRHRAQLDLHPGPRHRPRACSRSSSRTRPSASSSSTTTSIARLRRLSALVRGGVGRPRRDPVADLPHGHAAEHARRRWSPAPCSPSRSPSTRSSSPRSPSAPATRRCRSGSSTTSPGRTSCRSSTSSRCS